MALRIEITRQAFKLNIDLGETQVESENVNAVASGTLSFMESKACEDEDLADGVEIAGQLHQTADTIERNDVGWRVGKDYARWGDELFKDPAKRDQLEEILKPMIDGAVQYSGSALKSALMAILCDRYGIVSTITIEKIASLFMLCWNLFKTAIIKYSVNTAFTVLGKILETVIIFLSEKRFFDKLKEMGGWGSLRLLPKPSVKSIIKYMGVATAGIVIGGVAVYCYFKWKD